MSVTVNVYNLTSGQSDFTISFSYQKQSYVSVKVEDAAFADVSSNYTGTFTDATTYQFQDSNGAAQQIPSGYRVTFTRNTDISDDLFSFAAGTVIRPDALGESMKTLRDYTEEKNDQTANVTINVANDAVVSATSIATTKASEASASAAAASGSASAAAASQSAAATSESNASTSETNAAASQVASAASQTAAATSESNASTSETNAAASQVAAASSESNASTSETNAAASAASAVSARDIVREVILGQFADDAAVDTYLIDVSYTKDAGDLYFNTTDGRMKVYTGSAWSDIANTTSSASATASATAALAAQTAAEAALNTFVNQYLGSYASDAAVNAAKASVLSAGDIYFNTTTTQLKYYNGSAWNPAAAAQVLNTSSLGNVGDVDYTDAPQAGDYLYRDSSSPNKWVRRSVDGVKTDLNLPTDAVTALGNKLEAVDLDYTAAAGQGTVTSNAGTNAVITVVDSTNAGLMTPAQLTELGTALQPGNVVNDVTTGGTQVPLSAEQGKALQASIDSNTNAIGSNTNAIGNKQANITTSTALAAASLTTQETGDSGAVSVDIRKANVRTTTGTVDLVGGASLYNAGSAATYSCANLNKGDIVTVYAAAASVAVVPGASTSLFKDGNDITGTSETSVAIGQHTIATITMISDTVAIITGSAI